MATGTWHYAIYVTIMEVRKHGCYFHPNYFPTVPKTGRAALVSQKAVFVEREKMHYRRACWFPSISHLTSKVTFIRVITHLEDLTHNLPYCFYIIFPLIIKVVMSKIHRNIFLHLCEHHGVRSEHSFWGFCYLSRSWGPGHRQSHHTGRSVFIDSILIFSTVCRTGK